MRAAKRIVPYILTVILGFGAGGAAAQAWPSKPIRLVAPVAAGGGIDTVGRASAQKFTEAWKRPVFVDNRPGAGSTIGADMVAKSAPDGHTLLVNSMSQAIGALRMPDILQRVPGWGGEPADTAPEEFGARYRADVAKNARIVKEAHVPFVD